MKKEFIFDYREEQLENDTPGKPLTNNSRRVDKGCVNPELKYKNKLSSKSKPLGIVDIFIPFKHDNKNNDNHSSFAQMAEWTNSKTMSAGAGSF